MDEVRGKIKTSCNIIFVGLLAVAACMVLGVIYNSGPLLGLGEGYMTFENPYGWLISIVRPILHALLFVYTAFMFRTISTNETPFTENIPRKMKIVALLLFLSFALPAWMQDILSSISTGVFGFTFIGNIQIVALVVSGFVFIMAQIFKYGFLLQDENYEIL